MNTIIHQVSAADDWVQKNLPATVEVFAKLTGLSPKVSQVFIERRPKPSGASPMTATETASQQALADTFSELKIIPKAIKIEDAVWKQP